LGVNRGSERRELQVSYYFASFLLFFHLVTIISAIMDLSRIIAADIDGRVQNTRYRQAQFHRLQTVLVEHVADIQDAIRADSGHSVQEIRAEIALALQELRTHYLSLSLEKDLEVEYRIANGKDSLDGSRGAGIVYIVPCTHTLFFSVISALTAALAAGNCIVLEVSCPAELNEPGEL
jgi:acyl-CoA reductase-like NAD-dependent aldehyde dehydrogenase